VVTTTPVSPALQGPAERRVRLGNEAVVNRQRRQVQTGTSAVAVPIAPPPAPAPAAVAGGAPAAPAERLTAVSEALPDVSEDQPALRWELGTLALPRDEERITAERPVASVAILGDEWALIPAQSPVAQRRLTLRLDDQPLLAGPLTLVVDDAIVGVDALEAMPPGASLALRAGEDAALFASPAVAWSVASGEQSERRQRQGSTITLHNLGDAPRTVAVYQAMPVSRSAEITVTLSGTTEGATAIEPGVLRWSFTIPGGGRQEVALGWVLTAGGGLKL